MREILFRGIMKYENSRYKRGQWVIGDLVRLQDGNDGKPHIYGYGEVFPDTVGQYTGLTDKNGKKIFEGDIVAQSWYDYHEPSDDSFGEVVFCEYDCSFSVMDVQKDGIVPLGRCHAYHWEAEVIGNLHDNPELLEV